MSSSESNIRLFTDAPGRRRFISLLYGLSGFAGLVYELVWIREAAGSLGNTLLSFSTVVSVFLGGLAWGACLGERLQARGALRLFGMAEIWIGVYALAVPHLLAWAPQFLALLYNSAGGPTPQFAALRAMLVALILLPATIPMGATLPWLAAALADAGQGKAALNRAYALNTAGGTAGAVFAGFLLLPAFGYRGTLLAASGLDMAVGLAALWLSPAAAVVALSAPTSTARRSGRLRGLCIVAALSGCTTMLYEVTSTRIAGLMFGPTAATVAITLAVVLTGLAAGAFCAPFLAGKAEAWLPVSQLLAAAILLCVCFSIAVSPAWLADRVRTGSQDPLRLQLSEAGLLLCFLLPLIAAAGTALPVSIRLLKNGVQEGSGIGLVYGFNTLGAIAGTLLTAWWLIPRVGSERTLCLGALVNAALAVWLFRKPVWKTAGAAVAALAVTVFLFPQWDLSAMTAGAYKYAPYYTGDARAELHRGELLFLREGTAGTVTVRRGEDSRILAIDGKVDATDSGGDLLTEKLLAQIPLALVPSSRDVCLIGLASGVTAGEVLNWPVARMDTLELSPEVVTASHFFDAVNGAPLSSPRTHLIVNDGRNHLELTAQRYDAIVSEPSNPWIAGMNSLFTREFFRIARSRLRQSGVMAQWFHLYNMPPADLRSLLRSFTDVFPATLLWQLNEGDVLLTGFAADRFPQALRGADLSHASLLATLYVMGGEDLLHFARDAEPNTDDHPLLEFNGTRALHLQSDETNARLLADFPKAWPPPRGITLAAEHITPDLWMARGQMFESAESYRLAFDSYSQALSLRTDSAGALAGMLRTARTPDRQAIAGTLESRTREALSAAQAGDAAKANRILLALSQAFPNQPETHYNYGLFCLERSHYADAARHFNAAIAADGKYLPAFEAMAETSLRRRDFPNAALWSRRILAISPGHPVATRTLAASRNSPAQ